MNPLGFFTLGIILYSAIFTTASSDNGSVQPFKDIRIELGVQSSGRDVHFQPYATFDIPTSGSNNLTPAGRVFGHVTPLTSLSSYEVAKNILLEMNKKDGDVSLQFKMTHFKKTKNEKETDTVVFMSQLLIDGEESASDLALILQSIHFIVFKNLNGEVISASVTKAPQGEIIRDRNSRGVLVVQSPVAGKEPYVQSDTIKRHERSRPTEINFTDSLGDEDATPSQPSLFQRYWWVSIVVVLVLIFGPSGGAEPEQPPPKESGDGENNKTISEDNRVIQQTSLKDSSVKRNQISNSRKVKRGGG